MSDAAPVTPTWPTSNSKRNQFPNPLIRYPLIRIWMKITRKACWRDVRCSSAVAASKRNRLRAAAAAGNRAIFLRRSRIDCLRSNPAANASLPLPLPRPKSWLPKNRPTRNSWTSKPNWPPSARWRAANRKSPPKPKSTTRSLSFTLIY